MKKTLDVAGINTNYGDTVFTLGIGAYERTNNIRLTIEADGKEYLELTVDVKDRLSFGYFVVNADNRDAYIYLLQRNDIGSREGQYYINGNKYDLFYINK